jgi:hypothetical protein
MESEQPDFAKQWAQQWKQAAPKLQAIRDEELLRLDGNVNSSQQADLPCIVYDRNPQQNGLVIMQRWFQRQAILQCRCAVQSSAIEPCPVSGSRLEH